MSTLQQRKKEIKKEIKKYSITNEKAIETLLELARLGFEYTGHGTALRSGEQDFTLIKRLTKDEASYIHVTVIVTGRRAGKVVYQSELVNITGRPLEDAIYAIYEITDTYQ